MTAPVLAYQFDPTRRPVFSDLDDVRRLCAATTDEGDVIPAGTVVAVWGDGAAYEVEFETGLATVVAALLSPLER